MRIQAPSYTGPAEWLRAELSPFGYLLSVTRLNNIQTRHLRAALGLPASVVNGLRTGQVNWSFLSRWEALRNGASETQLKHALDGWESLLPYRTTQRTYCPPQLRACYICLQYGFHSLIQQLPWIRLCPWHQQPLVEHCFCGRSLLASMGNRSPLRLADCLCGHDHFRTDVALSDRVAWPLGAVRDAHETYRKEAALLRSDWMWEPDDVSITDGHSALLREALPPRFVGPSDPIARTFDEAAIDLNEYEAGAIMKCWELSEQGERLRGTGATISTQSYARIVRLAQLVNVEAEKRYNIRDFIGIYQGAIIFKGDVLVSPDAGVDGSAYVEGRVLGEVRSRELAALLTPFEEDSDRRAVAAAAALSEIATLVAMDHLEGLLHSANALADKRQCTFERRHPVVRVQCQPRLRITVTLTDVDRPSYIIEAA